MKKTITATMIFLVIGLTFWACSEDSGTNPVPEPDIIHYKLYQHGDVKTSFPSYVDIMFNITDKDGKMINFLTIDDFNVFEDGQPISSSESSMIIKGQGEIPYTIKTVLMLDNSMSIGAENLTIIKNAAIELVNQIIPNQEIAIWSFSEDVVQIVDFTDNVQTLINSINSITLGYNSTNLYGALIEGVNQWENTATDEQIIQGVLVIMTDGEDTQSSFTLENALNARDKKLVFSIGLGEDVNPEVLSLLSNGGYMPVADIVDLSSTFQEIQSQIEAYAGSFYWVNYLSPKRGNNDHTLKVMLKENDNTDSTSYIIDTFNSGDFYSVGVGIYINTTAVDQDGIEEINIYENNEKTLQGESYFGENIPVFAWSIADGSKLELVVDQDDHSLAIVKGLNVGTTTLTLSDTANDYSRNFDVEVLNNPISCQITNPTNNTTISEREDFLISVEASDNTSAITKVEIYINDSIKVTDKISPYEYNWRVSDEVPGNYIVKAIAYNENLVIQYDASLVNLELDSLLVFPQGELFSTEDPNGVDNINLYQNNVITLKGVSHFGQNTPIYEWSVANQGIVGLNIDTSDNSLVEIEGISQGSTTLTLNDVANGFSRSFYVEILENPISCTILNPVNNSSISNGTELNIEVNAFDNTSIITKVEIYIDNELKISDASVPYEYKWMIFSLDSRNYEISAVAYNAYGYKTSTSTINLDMPSLMVFVKGGSFNMGDILNESYILDQIPVHEVLLDDFLIGRYEVTQYEWEMYMGNHYYSHGNGDNYPAYDLNWYGAIKYCNLRSIAEGLTPCFLINNSTNPEDWGNVPNEAWDDMEHWDAAFCDWNANGYRLPTEAEWEYAARGGQFWMDSLSYSGGNSIDAVAWYNSNSNSISHPVGTKAPNQLEIYDMSGNQYEFCWDWYNNLYYTECYESGIVTNPKGPSFGESRVRRGGWWGTYSYLSLSAHRYEIDFMFSESYSEGLRLVRSVK